MRVCYITTGLVNDREFLIGINKKTDLLLIYSFRNKGNTSRKEIDDFVKKHNINMVMVDFTNRRSRSLKGIKDDYKLVSKIKSFAPDLIYVGTLISPYFAFFLRLIVGNENVLLSIMDYKLHERAKKSLRFSEKFYKYFSFQFFKHFHFYSYSQERLFKKDFPKKNGYVVRIYLVGTDLPILKRTGDQSKINFLYFGRIFYYKGVDILIKATNILSEKYKNFKVTIAGSCSTWEEEYAPLIKDRQVFDLKIEFISKEDLPMIFSEADFFVVPYREVTQSGPLLRAYHYNLIPIASNEEGFLEFIEDDRTGFIFENENYKDLAKVMEMTVNLPLSQRNRLKNNIEEFKKSEFDIENLVTNYLDMFRKVINKKAS